MNRRSAALAVVATVIVAFLSSATAPRATAQLRPRVERVMGATGDAWDVATVGDRVLVATSGGLAVSGGSASTIVDTAGGLPGSRARSVSVLGDSAWVGGVDGAAEVSFTTGSPRVVRTLPLRRVSRVVRFAGALWLATAADGLYRLAGGAAAEPVPVALGESHARARITDLLVRNGELWVATGGAGIFVLDARGHVARRYFADRGLPDDMIWDLEADGRRVWVATLRGVAAIEGTRVRGSEPLAAAVQALPVHDVRPLARTETGLDVATWGAGAWRLSAIARPRRLGASLHARWVGTVGDAVLVAHEAGVDRVAADGTSTALLGPSLPSPDLTAIARAFGRIWVGTYGSGLASLRGDTIEPVAQSNMDGRIDDLAVTRDTNGTEVLWIATARGLWRHDGRSLAPVRDPTAPAPDVHVTALHVSDDGALWVASTREVSRFAGRAWRAFGERDGVPFAQLDAIATDTAGKLWVGSLHGLVSLDPATGALERHTVSSGALPVDWVTSVARFGDAMVAGTYHGGLAIYRNARFTVEPEGPRGIPSGWVNPHAIAAVDGALFIGTLDRGLVVGRPGTWTELHVRDGLPSDDVTDVLPDGPRAAWIATRGGLARGVWGAVVSAARAPGEP